MSRPILVRGAHIIDSSDGIEEVGARLRDMMPWIAKNRLVDKSKN